MIAVYITTENMTEALHAEATRRLQATDAPEDAMRLHSVFGEEGKLQVFDIWDSEEAFNAFAAHLGPILEEMGIKMGGPPAIMPLVDLVQQ
jgi:hypothetical protein